MAYYMYIENILFPVTPGKISTKINGRNETLTLINEGEVNLIKSPGLTEIEIDELLLPAVQIYPFANYPLSGKLTEFHEAKYYLDLLEKWKKGKKPVHWKLLRGLPDGSSFLWDSDMDVTIEDYEIVEDAEEYGLDVCVKLSMKQYKYFGSKKLIPKSKRTKSGQIVVQMKRVRAKKKNAAKSYTVKKGDSLRGIAKKQLNNANRWKEIYKLNEKKIQSAAKKHGKPENGQWLFSGMKLTLPKY